jgi:hypothetical protein
MMSILPAAAVIIGAPASPQSTPVKVALPFPVTAGCFTNSVKLVPSVAGGIVTTQAVEAVSVTSNEVPLVMLNVQAVPTPVVVAVVEVSAKAAIVVLPLTFSDEQDNRPALVTENLDAPPTVQFAR